VSEITIGIKTVITIVSSTVAVVSAYWLARRAAAKTSLKLERQINKLKIQLATTQNRDEVKVLVSESLESLSVMIAALGNETEANSDELKMVLIQQGILNEKVRVLEEHYRGRSS